MNKLEDLLNNFWNSHKSNAGVAYVYTHKLSIAWIACVLFALILGFLYQGKAAVFKGIAGLAKRLSAFLVQPKSLKFM